MKDFVKVFLKRGFMFCGGGPLIVAIIYISLSASGTVETLGVNRVITEILSSLLLAFIAAGISAVYTVEKLPYSTAGLIQGSVLFADYLIIYLLNGWIPFKWQAIALFTAIFLAVFLTICLIIYLSVRAKIKKLNEQIQ